jgi:hypothetical protein
MLDYESFQNRELKCEMFGNALVAGGRDAREEEFPHMVCCTGLVYVDMHEYI